MRRLAAVLAFTTTLALAPASADAQQTSWAQPQIEAVVGAGLMSRDIAWWALLVAVVLTWVSGLDYARVAPRLWRGGAVE